MASVNIGEAQDASLLDFVRPFWGVQLVSPVALVALSVGAIGLVACGGGGSYEDGDSYGGYGGDGDGDGDGDTVEPENELTQDTGPVCDASEEKVLYLSSDDSNSMSAPVQVRARVLEDGIDFLDGVSIRLWELFNYYRFPYEAAPAGQLGVHAAMQEDGDGLYTLQIGVSSEALAIDARKPLNLTLVLDTSGSMAGTSITRLRQVCSAIFSQLKVGDIVSAVQWDTEQAALLQGHLVTGPDDPALAALVDGLEAGGGTDLSAGLEAGYALAEEHYSTDLINRVILISDGGANVGVTDEELIAVKSEGANGEGIYLVGVGVGSAGYYNDMLMDVVTDAGKGAAVFIDSAAEAWRVFHDDFLNTLSVAARDVEVEVTLPPGFEVETFSGEEISENRDEVTPQHIAPNDAMVFHQSINTCAAGLLNDDTEVTVRLFYKDAVTYEAKETTHVLTFAELLAAPRGPLVKGIAVFAYGDALIRYKADTGTRDTTLALENAAARIGEALVLLEGDVDLLEMAAVIDALHASQSQ